MGRCYLHLRWYFIYDYAVYDNDEEDDELDCEDDSKERAQEADQCDPGYYFDCDRHGYDTARRSRKAQ